MKKFIAIICCSIVFLSAQAQDTTLKEYVGKYTYPAGSYITSSEIILDGDNLKALSDKGSATLDKKAKDTIALRERDGMVYFFRNAEGKVARVKVVIGDLLLEGTKDGVTAMLHRDRYLDVRKQSRMSLP